MLGFNGVFCIMQALLVLFYVPESPIEMVEKMDFIEAKRIIAVLYNERYV